MALLADHLPFATALDPTDDPPTSVDPLGTLAGAERFADILLPGFTTRMWRPRLVTFATLASVVADRVVASGGRENLRLPARLAFERLYVTAIVRAVRERPGRFSGAMTSLPGNALAGAALDAGEPLVRSNFLRGQAVNGPSGVMVRLARSLSLVGDDWRPGVQSSKLLLAWAEDRRLAGLLDERRSGEGGTWLSRILKYTTAVLDGNWPGPGQQVWDLLADHLRPDRIHSRERDVLTSLLDADGVRARFLARLTESSRAYEARRDHTDVERTIMLEHVRHRLGHSDHERQIATVLQAVDAYESTSALLQQTFDSLLWGLRARGRASVATLVRNHAVMRVLARSRLRLPGAARALDRATTRIRERRPTDAGLYTEPLAQLRELALRGALSNEQLVGALLERHEKVQRAKRKAAWIDRSDKLILVPGFGVGGDAPQYYEGTFLHPFRIKNAYSFLRELKLLRTGHNHGQA